MKLFIALVLAALTVPAVASAQAGDAQQPLSLTLEDAVARGLAASYRVAEAIARHDAADAAITGRHAATLPQVVALGGYTRTNHVEEFGILQPSNQLRVIYPDVPDNYRTRLDLLWPIYTGGRLDALTDAARKESAATANDVETLRADLKLEITRAFWTLVLAGESARVVDESLARMSAHLRDVRNQLDSGLVPPSDVLSVEAQESRQRMLGIQARSARDVAEAELGRLVDVPPGVAIDPEAVLEPVGIDTTYESLVAQAREQRRDRQALIDRLAGADFRQQAAAAGRRPAIAVAGGVDYARPNARIFPRQQAWQESWDAGLLVSWSLFDGGRTRGEVAEASASRRMIQARLEELDSVLALEVRQRIAEIESSRAAIAAAEDAVRAATEARRVIGNRFNAGVATSTDLLDAQVAVLQASLDRTQALANARLADARLHRAVGQ